MKRLLLVFLLLFMVGCDVATTTTMETADLESACKDTPLAEACYQPSGDLNHITPTPEEYTIDETFDTDRLNQQPRNWLLYSNAEYLPNGVYAKVVEGISGRHVQLYSNGLARPPHPQSAPVPTFIFSTKFNLDQARAGVAYADVMVPSTNKNAVTVGISTGAVNAISITVDNDLKLVVKVGGPFYYYSLTGDGGTLIATSITLQTETWYSFRFEWDAEANVISAYLVQTSGDTLLHSGPFHLSNRFNALETGAILVPNNVKVTMPRGQSGFAYLDNVRVERKAE
jgi:hypothetical protein